MSRGLVQPQQTGHGASCNCASPSIEWFNIIELAKSKGLIVTKVAPSGVAAHLIGVSIHFFPLDIKLRKTDIISVCWTFTVSMHQRVSIESSPNMVHLGYPLVVGTLLCLETLPSCLMWVEAICLVSVSSRKIFSGRSGRGSFTHHVSSAPLKCVFGCLRYYVISSSALKTDHLHCSAKK